MVRNDYITMIAIGRKPTTWAGFNDIASAIREAERHCKKHIFLRSVYQIFYDGRLVRYGFRDGKDVFWNMAI